MLRSRFAIVCAALSVCLLLVACLPSPRPQAPTHLKVAILPNLSFAPLFIAADEGLFTEQKLEVEFVRFARTADAIPALAKGDVDAVIGGLNVGMINAIARETGIKMVADKGSYAMQDCAPAGLVARKALVESGELAGAAQLKGRKVSVTLANYEEYMVDTLLHSAGLTMDDISTVDLDDPAVIEGFKQGTLDVASISDPWLTRAVDSGAAVLWKSSAELALGFQYSVVLYGPNLLQKNSTAGEALMVAYLKGLRQYQLGKTERNVEIIAKYTEQDPQVILRTCWPAINTDGRVNVQSVLDFQAWAVGRELLEKPVESSQFWDPRFVDHANQQVYGGS